MNFINLAHFVPCTENEGPGKRAVFWVQGCHFNCEGCCNMDLQPFNAANLMDTESLICNIKRAVEIYNIEGITLVGGEPMLQAKKLSIIAKFCQEVGLSVIVFTGFTLELLKKKPVLGSSELLANTDVLIDGLYLKNKPEMLRNWCGSSNQKFHYLSNKYDSSIESDSRYVPTIEIAIAKKTIRINGYPL